jgi:hypothetical protein
MSQLAQVDGIWPQRISCRKDIIARSQSVILNERSDTACLIITRPDLTKVDKVGQRRDTAHAVLAQIRHFRSGDVGNVQVIPVKNV